VRAAAVAIQEGEYDRGIVLGGSGNGWHSHGFGGWNGAGGR